MGVCISRRLFFLQNQWINTCEYLLSVDKISIFVFISMYFEYISFEFIVYFRPFFLSHLIPEMTKLSRLWIQQKF